ncbi:hypothetical protein [Streptomyces sp. NPDC026673]|uniref:hypothetical protein n=1 Tax=Streptomyces sp. NPDC026673 TaxID=3155724 RepID=UPI0033E0C617
MGVWRACGGLAMRRVRWTVTGTAAAVVLGLAGCSAEAGGDDSGTARQVTLVNSSAWTVRVFGCPNCGSRGLGVVSGSYYGWRERRPLPLEFSVVVRGVRSTCPALVPLARDPGEAGGRDWNVEVDAAGTCVAGPASLDP